MIYKFLFVSDHPEKLIMPDLNGPRAPIRRSTPDLSNALPLLRTCQYVHEEAVSVLYGSNIFIFSDEPYGDDQLKIIGFDFEVRWCNFVTMYGFFSRIGSRNRARIRHLRLDFLSKDFIAYPDEIEEGCSRHGGAANYVGDALELLSPHHNLHSFELVFGRKDSVADSQFHSMFRRRTPRKLVRRMMQFKDVREVKDLHLGNSHLPDGRDDGPLIHRDLLEDEDLSHTDWQRLRKICRTYAYDNFLASEKE